MLQVARQKYFQGYDIRADYCTQSFLSHISDSCLHLHVCIHQVPDKIDVADPFDTRKRPESVPTT